MAKKYKIHPAIGVARIGNSPEEFCIGAEAAGALPTEYDPFAKPGTPGVPIQKFRDSEGRIKRQAARFQIHVEDESHPAGRPLEIGDKIEGGGNSGTLIAIEWRVYLANKKSVWYEFQQLDGEHGYPKNHPRRNSDITDSNSRQKLIIDPGPQTITSNRKDGPQKAQFSRDGNPEYATVFPPKNLNPHDIDTLGEILTDDQGQLLVLGGHGNSGSMKTGLGEPSITNYANNDGWFDDTSDGPVMARLKMTDDRTKRTRYVDVNGPAWVLCAYPNYVPAVLDMITMADVMQDLEVREFAGNTYLYGARGSFKDRQMIDSSNPEALAWWKKQDLVWNTDYHPLFYRDIWPILKRPDDFKYLSDILLASSAPHDKSSRGTFFMEKLSSPDESNRKFRQYLFSVLRQPGDENRFSKKGSPDSTTFNVPLMPLLCGDNPITNLLPSKFLRLTDTQLFILRQWADGKFVNEGVEMAAPKNVTDTITNGNELDRGVLSNVLGGAFCPGGEIGWIMRNPSIYREPYRIKADPIFANFRQTAASATGSSTLNQAYATDTELSQKNNFDRGLQPGDLTKYMSIPWQADYNECTIQTIDTTYDLWSQIDASNEKDSRLEAMRRTWITLWWPAHHPLQTYELIGLDGENGNFSFLDWDRGIPATNEGDLKMVSAWKDLGFVVNNPFHTKYGDEIPPYISVERNPELFPLPSDRPISNKQIPSDS